MNRYELKVLILEDDLILAENLKENLHELGYRQITIVTNSIEAEETYKNFQPDICLVDVRLSGSPKDGIETMHHLKAGFEIPLIYLTAFDDQQTRERAKKTNPSAYLIKPAGKNQIDVSIDIALHAFYHDPHAEQTIHCPIVSNKSFIFIRIQERYEKVHFRDVLYVRAEGSYCHLYSLHKEYMISMNLGKMVEKFGDANLIRCHRSYAVNQANIHSFDNDFLYVSNGYQSVEVPVGVHYKLDISKALPKL